MLQQTCIKKVRRKSSSGQSFADTQWDPHRKLAVACFAWRYASEDGCARRSCVVTTASKVVKTDIPVRLCQRFTGTPGSCNDGPTKLQSHLDRTLTFDGALIVQQPNDENYTLSSLTMLFPEKHSMMKEACQVSTYLARLTDVRQNDQTWRCGISGLVEMGWPGYGRASL